MTEKKLIERTIRVKQLIRALQKKYTNAGMILRYTSHWELLVAVMLSAQCTDKKVNEVTKQLFKKYKTLNAYIQADPRAFEKDIFSTGFYRNKTKNILAAAHCIKKQYNNKVPKTMRQMLAIPGVARKTANVVLGNAYGVVEGIAVDTHVRKFAIRFDLTDYVIPEKIEQDLMRIVPKKDWFRLTYLIIDYGRDIKSSQQPDFLASIYPQSRTRWQLAKK